MGLSKPNTEITWQVEGSPLVVKRREGQGCGGGGWGRWEGGERTEKGRRKREGREKESICKMLVEEQKKNCQNWKLEVSAFLVSASFLTSSVTSALTPPADALLRAGSSAGLVWVGRVP